MSQTAQESEWTYDCSLCGDAFKCDKVKVLYIENIVCDGCIDKHTEKQLAKEIAKTVLPQEDGLLDEILEKFKYQLHPFIPKVTDPRGWLKFAMEQEYNKKHRLVFGYNHDWTAEELDRHNQAFLKKHPTWIQENPNAEVEVTS